MKIYAWFDVPMLHCAWILVLMIAVVLVTIMIVSNAQITTNLFVNEIQSAVSRLAV